MESCRSEVINHQKGKRLNPYQHCLLRPDMYLGSTLTTVIDAWITILDPNSPGCYITTLKKIRHNPGLFNIIRETVSNAIDNVWRSKQLTPDNLVKKITITINSITGRISVKNDGYCIPVRQLDYDYEDPRTGVVSIDKFYPAEVFFGDFNSGTNYEDTALRKTSGRNGVGAKLPVTFSTQFEVECANHDDHKLFHQTYFKNGSSRSEPNIKVYAKKKGYTCISYIPDYKYFKYPTEEDAHIDDNFISILRMYAHEVSVITSCPVEFIVDEVVEIIKVPSMEKFARLFYPCVTDNKMLSFKTYNGDECVLIESDPTEMDECESVTHISYVNGVRTKDGGIHVDTWKDSIIGAIVKTFNQRKVKKDTVITKASARQVYPYLCLFIRTEVDRPKFSSQAKDELVEMFDDDGKSSNYKLFDIKSKLEREKWKEQMEEALKKIMKWGFVGLLEEKLSGKAMAAIAKKEGSDMKIPLGRNGRHANWANTDQKHKTTFCIVEGKSPKGFVERGIDCIDNGKDLFGVFAIKGKFINAIKNSEVKVLKNQEAKTIRSALNLKKGLDYSIEANYNTLHYGSVDLVPDQDSDGIHIRALLLGFFSGYKGLLEIGYVNSVSTAVAAIVTNAGKNNEKKMLFYSLQEFNDYVAVHGVPKGSTTKYYKGLGSIKPQDAPLYFGPSKRVNYTKGEDAYEMLLLGIGPASENCNQRKKLITCDVDESFVEQPDRIVLKKDIVPFVYEGKLDIGCFIRDQVVIYHKEALERAVPCIYDGLKDGQRKILYTLLLPKASYNMDLEKATGLIKSNTNYHHGGTSVQSTIVGMAQRYVGSNNIPLLMDDGEVGTRLENGGDAAAGRYVHTQVEDITRILFPKEDNPILVRNIEDDEEVEYKYFVPILPMVLINGARGIGSGWSTNIPCYNPLHIVERIEGMLDGKDIGSFPKLIPWYMGYTGKIQVEDDMTWSSRGILEPVKNGYWHIKELALGVATCDFKEWLEYLQHGVVPEDKKWKKLDNKVIKDVQYYCDVNTIDFKIKPTKDFKPDIDTKSGLGKYMKATHSLKNMQLVDGNIFPHKFDSPEAIIKAHYTKRINTYRKRRDYDINRLTKEIVILANKHSFLGKVLNKEIRFADGKNAVIKQLEEFGYDKILVEQKQKKKKTKDEIKDDIGDKDDTKDKNIPSYAYLLRIQILGLLPEKLAILANNKVSLEIEKARLEAISLNDMWRAELSKFKVAYAEFLKHRTQISNVKRSRADLPAKKKKDHK